MLHGRKWSMNTSCIHSGIFFSAYYVLFQAMGIWWRKEKSLSPCLIHFDVFYIPTSFTIRRLSETYALDSELLFRYGVVERFSDGYLVVIYKDYKCEMMFYKGEELC